MDENEIRSRLADRILPRVADATGLHYATILRFMKGEGPFRRATIQVLRDYLAR